MSTDPQIKQLGRRKPYTAIGAHRMRCSRYVVCGNRARLQWQTCAIGNRWILLCAACDLELNRQAVVYTLGHAHPEHVVEAVEVYRQKLIRNYGAEALLTKEERGGLVEV